ncbi:hypothetical protein RAS1_41460 [Phycisphaerae bacterium RAS1]|nr:hypothetical protein RAS1_41460 [Phycisphaerae bacterium RAS1]
MKTHLVTLAIAASFALPSSAQTAAARWFFSLTGLSDPNNIYSPALSPANLATRVNPDGGVNGCRLYLWCSNPVSGRAWNGFQNYGVEIRGGDAVISDVLIYNLGWLDGEPSPEVPIPGPNLIWRWAYVGDVSGEGTQSVSGITM